MVAAGPFAAAALDAGEVALVGRMVERVEACDIHVASRACVSDPDISTGDILSPSASPRDLSEPRVALQFESLKATPKNT
eukprot:COSAG01_NODE_281_length_19504_cov_129.173124_21_plen_80_part_00